MGPFWSRRQRMSLDLCQTSRLRLFLTHVGTIVFGKLDSNGFLLPELDVAIDASRDDEILRLRDDDVADRRSVHETLFVIL